MILGKRTFETQITGYKTTNLDKYFSVTAFSLFFLFRTLIGKTEIANWRLVADDPQGTDTIFTGQFSPVKRSVENSSSGQIEFSFKVYIINELRIGCRLKISFLFGLWRDMNLHCLVEEHMLYFGEYTIQKRPEVLGQNSLISLRQVLKNQDFLVTCSILWWKMKSLLSGGSRN